MPENLKRSGTLQHRNLKNILGNAAQGRHKQNHVVAQIFPQKKNHNHHLGKGGIEPVHLVSLKKHKNLVHHPVIMKQYLPDQNYRCNGHHHGTQKKRPELTPERNFTFQHHGQHQRQYHCQRHRYKRKRHGIAGSLFKGVILEHRDKVVKKYKLPADGVIHHRIEYYNHKGQHEKQQYSKNTGKQVSCGYQFPSACSRTAAFFAFIPGVSFLNCFH